MPTIVQRVSNAGAQGTRWRATPNAHQRKDQTVKISAKREETTRQGWLIFTAVNWLSFIALQTLKSGRDFSWRSPGCKRASQDLGPLPSTAESPRWPTF